MLNLAAHPDVHDAVNEHIFVYALSAALIQRKDARSLRLPPIYEIFPGNFFGKETNNCTDFQYNNKN